MADETTTTDQSSDSSASSTPSSATTQASSGGTSFFGFDKIFTTPYGGGEWETEFVSTMSPEQQEFYNQLLKSAGSLQASQAQYEFDPESLSISALDTVRQEQALSTLQGIMDADVSQETINANKAAAVQSADEAINALKLKYAGVGSSSSTASRAAGKVQTELGTAISQIYADALQEAEDRRLTAATQYGTLSNEISAQDLQRLIANQSTGLTIQENEANLALQNAALSNDFTAAQMQYLLGLANVQTGENISTQAAADTLHKDIFSGKISDVVSGIFG